MSTLVTGRRARVIRSDTFADLTDAAVLSMPPEGVLFDADLDPATVTAIRERMTSRDDDDQAARANLRNLLATGDPGLREALTNYVLGE